MFNQATILGRLGKDPESRTLPNGRAVVNFSLATSERWKDKESGEQREATEWHNCTAYARPAEVIVQYVKKGDLLMVQGQLKTRKWTDKNGVDRYTTGIEVRDFKLMPNPKSGDEQTYKSRGKQDAEPGERAPFNDDIPF